MPTPRHLQNDFVNLFLFNIDFNKVGGCPDNWEELEITQDSGEVFNFFHQAGSKELYE